MNWRLLGFALLLLIVRGAALPLSAATTWTGAVSTDWGNSGNWSNGVPTQSVNAVIPGNPSGGRFPVISSGSYKTRKLTIDANGELTQTGGSLEVRRDFVVNSGATFTFIDGTLVCDRRLTLEANGALVQRGGSVYVNWKLKLNAGASYTLTNGDLAVTDILDVSNGGAFIQSGGTVATTDDIKIRDAASYTLSGGTVSTNRNLELFDTGTFIQSGGTITILKDFSANAQSTYTQTNGLMQIDEAWKNSGTFSSSGGTVQFIGTGLSNYSNGTNQFYDVVVDAGVDPRFDRRSGSQVLVAGDFVNNNSTLDNNDKVTFVFNGTGDQTITSASSSGNTTFGNFQVNKSSGSLTLLSDIEIAGDADVTQGTFNTGAYGFDRDKAGGTITVSSGATLNIGGTNTFPSNFSTVTLDPASTVGYVGSDQAVAGEITYGNLVLSGSGTKTMPTSSATIDGDLTVSGSAVMDPNGGSVILSSTAGQTVTGAASFYDVSVNSGGDVALAGDVSVSNTLTFLNGNIVLGSSDMTIGGSGTITGASSSRYVVTNGSGSLRQVVSSSGVVFPVGTSTSYAPVTIANAGTTDTFAVKVQGTFDNPPYGDAYVNLQWTVDEAVAGGSDATLTFQWNGSDERPTFNRSNSVYIGRWAGSTWNQTLASVGGSDPYTASAGGFSAFGPFGVGNDKVFPVELVSFDAEYVSGIIRLRWVTLSEFSNAGFAIERSLDGAEWSDIAWEHGHGTTAVRQEYEFMDDVQRLPYIPGMLYYRLKQVDREGDYEYSPVVSVRIHGLSAGARLLGNFPNPFRQETTIQFELDEDIPVILTVVDAAGRTVERYELPGSLRPGRYSIPFVSTNLAPGMYFYYLHMPKTMLSGKMTVLR